MIAGSLGIGGVGLHPTPNLSAVNVNEQTRESQGSKTSQRSRKETQSTATVKSSQVRSITHLAESKSQTTYKGESL